MALLLVQCLPFNALTLRKNPCKECWRNVDYRLLFKEGCFRFGSEAGYSIPSVMGNNGQPHDSINRHC